MKNESIFLFDLDGVLIKALQFNLWLRETYGISREETQKFFRGPFIECSVGRRDLYETLRPFIEEWKVPYSPEEFCDIWFEMDGSRMESGYQLLEECKDRKILTGLATTQEARRKKYILSNYPEIEDMDFHFFSCDVGYKKPQREFYEHVSLALGEDKKVCFIDDSEENVNAALASGWLAHHYTNQTSLNEFDLFDSQFN